MARPTINDVLATLAEYADDVEQIKEKLEKLNNSVVKRRSAKLSFEGHTVSLTPNEEDIHMWTYMAVRYKTGLNVKTHLDILKGLNRYVTEWFRDKPNPCILQPPYLAAEYNDREIWAMILGSSATHFSQEDFSPPK